MKLTNRLLTIGLGIGLCAISAPAMAHSDAHGNGHGSAFRIFAQYDQDDDGLVAFQEFSWNEMRRARAEFSRKDLNRDGILSFAERGGALDEDCETSPSYRRDPRTQLRVPRLQVAWQLERPHLVSANLRYRGMTEAEMRKQVYAEIKALFDAADLNNDRHLSRWEMARLQVRNSPSGAYFVSYEV